MTSIAVDDGMLVEHVAARADVAAPVESMHDKAGERPEVPAGAAGEKEREGGRVVSGATLPYHINTTSPTRCADAVN